MGSKKPRKQIAGHWYAAGMHLVFCHKIDSLEAIVVGERTLWYPGMTEYYQQWDPYACCRKPPEEVAGPHESTETVTYAPTLPPCISPSIAEICYHWVTHSRIVPPALISKQIFVNNLNLFGGEDQAGGIQGYIDLEFGEATQDKNDYLLTHTNGDISAHRNVFGMVLRHVTLSCNTTQIKEWAIRGKRMTTGDDWRPDLKEVTGGMNPAHIVRDCLTDTSWGGLGISGAELADFSSSAVILDNEGFGLSFIWRQNISIAAFIGGVLTHVNGMLFESYQTGLFTLKLLRDDYGDVSGLPELNTSNIISLESFDVKSTEEAVNACTIKYTNPTLDKDTSVTVTDPAAVERMGGDIVTIEKEYYGCRNGTLAVQIANRELNFATLPLASITIIVNRTVYDLDPGDAFSFSWAPYGFSDVVMRVTAIDYGSTESNVIRIDAITDVFAFGDIMVSPPDNEGEWEDPNNEPQNLINYRIEETTFYQAYTEHASDVPSVEDTTCYVQTIADKVTDDMIDYEMHDKYPNDLNYVLEDTAYFSTEFVITEAVVKQTSSLLKLNADLDALMINNNIIYEGSYGYLGDELVMISAFTENSDEFWVIRGIIDTVPLEHPIGTVFQLISDTFHNFSNAERLITEEVAIKLLPATFIRRLSLDESNELLYTCVGRAGKPYPPGKFLSNNEMYPEYVITNLTGGIIVSWTHRDRTQQIGDIIPQGSGNIGPEVGTTYNVRIYDSSPSLIASETGITNNFCVLQFLSAPGLETFILPAYSLTYAVASSVYVNWYAHLTMDPAYITTSGSVAGRLWMAGTASITQKFNINYGSPKFVTRFRLINTYDSTNALYADASIKNFSVYGSNESSAFSNTDYANTGDLTLLGTFEAIKATGYEQYQTFILTHPGIFQYYIIRFHDVQTAINMLMNLEYLEFIYNPADVDTITIPTETDWYSLEVESERDSLISYTKHETENIVVGYGKHYGRYYGTRPS